MSDTSHLFDEWCNFMPERKIKKNYAPGHETIEVLFGKLTWKNLGEISGAEPRQCGRRIINERDAGVKLDGHVIYVDIFARRTRHTGHRGMGAFWKACGGRGS